MASTDLIQSILHRFRDRWRNLLAVHLAASGLSAFLLTPLYALLLGLLVLASGDVALTDEDILHFALSPLGLLVFLVAAALGLALLVFEQAALILAVGSDGSRSIPGLLAVGKILAAKFMLLLRLTLGLVLRLAVAAAPIVALVAWIYGSLLGEYDINYYLAARPPEFARALLLAALCLLGAGVSWAMMLTNHLLALARMLLGPPASARDLLRDARRRAAGQRASLAVLLFAWILISAALLTAAGSVFDLGAEWAIRWAGRSLQTLAYLLGAVLAAWALAQFIATFLGSCLLALGLWALGRQLWPNFPEATAVANAKTEPALRVSLRLAGVLAAGVVAAAGWTLLEVAERQETDVNTRIIAHRGASAAAPENTQAAIELAIEQGADWIEIDVQESADGEIVVVHDADLMRVAGSPLRVRASTADELRQTDVGVRFGEEFAGQRVPLLQEVLEQARARTGVLIELKYYGGETVLERRVAEIVEEIGMVDSVQVMSLSLPGARRMQDLRPDWDVGLLSSVGVGDMTRMNVDFLAVNAHLAKRRFIERARARGRPVYAWTVNDIAQMSALMGRGVDGIITDQPGLAVQVRAEHAELELHELLIIRAAALAGSGLAARQ